MPEMVDSERTKESLMGYIHEKLHGAEEEHEEVDRRICTPVCLNSQVETKDRNGVSATPQLPSVFPRQ